MSYTVSAELNWMLICWAYFVTVLGGAFKLIVSLNFFNLFRRSRCLNPQKIIRNPASNKSRLVNKKSSPKGKYSVSCLLVVFSPTSVFLVRETPYKFNGNFFGWEKEINLNFGKKKRAKNMSEWKFYFSLMGLMTACFILFAFRKCFWMRHLKFTESQNIYRDQVCIFTCSCWCSLQTCTWILHWDCLYIHYSL